MSLENVEHFLLDSLIDVLGALYLYEQAAAVAYQVENLLEGGNGLRCGIAFGINKMMGADLLQGEFANKPLAIGSAVDALVVAHHHNTIGGEVEVYLNHIGTGTYPLVDAGQGILHPDACAATMRNHYHILYFSG